MRAPLGRVAAGGGRCRPQSGVAAVRRAAAAAAWLRERVARIEPCDCAHAPGTLFERSDGPPRGPSRSELCGRPHRSPPASEAGASDSEVEAVTSAACAARRLTRREWHCLHKAPPRRPSPSGEEDQVRVMPGPVAPVVPGVVARPCAATPAR